jgi:hypothetical protein
MKPATLAQARASYRKQARFNYICRAIVAEEMQVASAALDECERDPYRLREVVDYLATSVAARVLQTVYDNDEEISQWKAQVERLTELASESLNLKPTPVVKP